MGWIEKPEIYEISLLKGANLRKRFRIPVYQRPFAWGKEEVEILLNDLENICNENREQVYYLGNIVVDKKVTKKEEYLEVIDGQQRLTVLYLLWAILRKGDNKEPPFELKYEIREEDNNFLSKLKEIELNGKDFKEIQNRITQLQKETNAHPNFCEVITTILKWQNEKLNEKNKNGETISKIKVAFGITFLPKDTDVAKYFEVMNSRGKQLEQHQVLKAKFLHFLKEDKEWDYAKIWDYCSDMSVYLEDLIYENMEQGKIYSEIRKNFLKFVCGVCGDDKKRLEYFVEKGTKSQKEKSKLFEILKSAHQNKDHLDTSEQGEHQSKNGYKPIINFPTFLLHTLKLFVAMNQKFFQNKKIDWKKISLDDKKLIKTFDKCFEFKNKKGDKKEKAKEFIKFLLKIRILFDYFIFKRNLLKEERAELKRLKYRDGKMIFEEEKPDSLLMIQLLFNITAPQWKQQEWISCALFWLYKRFTISELNQKIEKIYDEFLKFLENLDKILALERLLPAKGLKEYSDLGRIFDEVIEEIGKINEASEFENLKKFFERKLEQYKNDLKKGKENGEEEIKNVLNKILNQGTATPHYWFYKLEYLLWKNAEEKFFIKSKEKFKKEFKKPFEENEKFKYENIKKDYILTRKSSIEHIHPWSRREEEGWEEIIDWFGNLSLISNYLNSVLLDKNFEDKRTRIQEQLNNGTIESLKMLLVYSKYENWTPKECNAHHEEMLKLLIDSIKPEDMSSE